MRKKKQPINTFNNKTIKIATLKNLNQFFSLPFEQSMFENTLLKEQRLETSLKVQGLRLRVPNAGSPGSSLVR